jgi:hypothetical protein
MIVDEENFLDEIDVNFDRYVDLEIFSHDGGAGPNYGNNYYIFNPRTGLFDFNGQLSALSQPSISSKNKIDIFVLPCRGWSSWTGNVCLERRNAYPG